MSKKLRKSMLKKLTRVLLQIRALFPSKLPVGVTAYKKWVKSFSETYDLATKDEDSINFVLATEIFRLDPRIAYKSKFYFYLAIEAAAAKQIAGAVFQEVKNRQQEAALAASKANET